MKKSQYFHFQPDYPIQIKLETLLLMIKFHGNFKTNLSRIQKKKPDNNYCPNEFTVTDIWQSYTNFPHATKSIKKESLKNKKTIW